MLDTLQRRFAEAIGPLRGSRQLTEKRIDETLRQVRRALLEADVALPVVRQFTDRVRTRATGSSVMATHTPAETIIGIVQDELIQLLGESNAPLNQSKHGSSVILLAGLQGSGKTTTAAKLARHLIETEKRRVLLVSVDIYRPAAMDQLRTLATAVGAEYWESDATVKPEAIATAAIAHARQSAIDFVIVDSAGRLHVDQEMMTEIENIQRKISPDETLFVIDAMIGQDAVNSASAFNESLALTGTIVTKLDSDARGGALISVRQVIGKPVKFIGVGEGVEALEQFHPNRIASRIIGMGDLQTLIESFESKSDQHRVNELAEKFRKGRRFDLADFRDQLQMALDLGGVEKIAKLTPGLSMDDVPDIGRANDSVRRNVAIINSMTKHERRHPAIIRASRRARIAAGAGVEVRFVSQLIREYAKTSKTMKKMKNVRGRRRMETPNDEQLKKFFSF